MHHRSLTGLSTATDISETKFAFLDDLKYVLEPIKLAVKALCCQVATLLIAEGIFSFLINEMKKMSSMAKR